MSKFDHENLWPQRLRAGSKKSVQQGYAWLDSSRRVRRIACFILKGETIVCARSVLVIREHGKMARTPLAAFFNRPIIKLNSF